MLCRLSTALLLLLPLSCRSVNSLNSEFLAAAASADQQSMQQLLQEGASPNATRHGGETALVLLISQYKRSHEDRRKRIEDTATELLASGADANALHHGFTPLQIATGQGSEAIVSRLLTYGAEPDLETRAGFAPIWQAVLDNNYQIGRILLQAGANPNALNEKGQTPLQYLRSKGFQKTRLMLYLRQHGGQ